MIKGLTLAAKVPDRQIQTDGATLDQTPDCLPASGENGAAPRSQEPGEATPGVT